MMSSAAARSATRIGWFISGTHTTAPWPTRMRCGLRGHRREEYLGRRTVRVLLEEVVLDRPDVIEAELVGQPALLERVVVDGELIRPRSNGRGVDSSKKIPNFTWYLLDGPTNKGMDPFGLAGRAEHIRTEHR